ncbi:hypothetical protein V6N12_029328 [Hibiscus sabdariffa]|uniref:Uncharacterized protein n=1 Tax=Hibiscus sabdariffa TaxID=183260 RepID=A0ABR2CVU6_9ROSI
MSCYNSTSLSPRNKGPAPFLSKTYALLEEGEEEGTKKQQDSVVERRRDGVRSVVAGRVFGADFAQIFQAQQFF